MTRTPKALLVQVDILGQISYKGSRHLVPRVCCFFEEKGVGKRASGVFNRSFTCFFSSSSAIRSRKSVELDAKWRRTKGGRPSVAQRAPLTCPLAPPLLGEKPAPGAGGKQRHTLALSYQF